MKFNGIDVSKDTFDVWNSTTEHRQYTNDKRGFKIFLKTLRGNDHCVMEATGCYHIQLATFLYNAHIPVSVAHALSIKRFIQMKLQRTKTDKSDAKMICTYAMEQHPTAWEPDPKFIIESKLRLTLITMYIKQSTQLKNKLHTLKSGGISKGAMIRSLNLQLKRVISEMDKLKLGITKIFQKEAPRELSDIMSIPGIG